MEHFSIYLKIHDTPLLVFDNTILSQRIINSNTLD
nr:MAG TPA: hypothetical protein [Caudoviricetes sp.]